MSRRVALALVAVALMVAACSGSEGPHLARRDRRGGVARGTTRAAQLTWDGRERSYLVHTPAVLDSSRRVPLVVMLHGRFSSAGIAERRYGWTEIADRERFVVVFPDGGDQRWNSSLEPALADDLGFLLAMLDRVEREYPIDRRRAFVAGFSNGAFMAYRLACNASNRVAAIAPVSGSIDRCAPTSPVSVLHIHGLKDTFAPFGGGTNVLGDTVPPVTDAIGTFRIADRCSAPPRTSYRGVVFHTTWEPCASGTGVELYTIDDGGNQWPQSERVQGLDPPSPAINATKVIWEFFSHQARR